MVIVGLLMFRSAVVSTRRCSERLGSFLLTMSTSSRYSADHVDLIVDTGSALTIVSTNDYTPGESAKDLGYTKTINFVSDGSFEVEMYTDTVHTPPLFATGVAIGVMPSSQDTIPNGLLALGPGGTAQAHVEPTYIEQLSRQGKLPNGGFTMDLGITKGTLTLDHLAGVDHPNNVWHEVVGNRWALHASIHQSEAIALIDSGTYLMTLSKQAFQDFADYYELEVIQGEHPQEALIAIGQCDSDVGLNINFGEQAVPIPADLLWRQDRVRPDGRCLSSIVGVEAEIQEEGKWVLGNLFLSAVIASFDYHARRIGLVAKYGQYE